MVEGEVVIEVAHQHRVIGASSATSPDDAVSDDLVMRVVNKPETSVLVNQYQYLADILHEQRALVAQVGKPLEKAKGTSSDITTSLLRILLTQ